MDKIILTEQEANTPVTWRDMQILMEYVSKGVNESKESDGAVIDVLINQIENLRYEQIKDIRFCLNVFSELLRLPLNNVYDIYNTWCEEFDQLNKSNLENLI